MGDPLAWGLVEVLETQYHTKPWRLELHGLFETK